MQITTLGAGATGIVLLAQWGMLEFATIAFIASFIKESAIKSPLLSLIRKSVKQGVTLT